MPMKAYQWLLLVLTSYVGLNASATTLYVDLNSTNPVAPYAAWGAAATNIQDAVDAAADGDLILVNNGIYRGGIVVTNALAIRSVGGANVTSIDGNSSNSCAILAEGTVLTGFTLTDGYSWRGAGARCASTNVLVNDCLIVNNVVSGDGFGFGGGVFSGTLSNCTLQANVCSNYNGFSSGGGAAFSTLNNCVVSDNQSSSGGGTYSCILRQCVLSGNQAYDGGADYGSALNDCLIINNRAFYNYSIDNCAYGGGLYCSRATNCTIVNNTVTTSRATPPSGGGAAFTALNNCIIYGNKYGAGTVDNAAYGTLYNCCTIPMPDNGGNNFTNAPLFVDQNNGNYRLQSISPCINSGDNAFVASATDLGGNPRVVGGTVDVGAYEYQVPLYFLLSPTNQILLAGTNFVLSATAVGDQPAYQWWFNGAPLADGGRISGATSNSLTISLSQTNDTGSYWVTASSSSGVVTSAVAVVTVLPQPVVITVHPTNRLVLTGSNTAFTVTAVGIAPPNYLWYSNGAALANGGRISGATSPTLTISSVQTNDSGAAYQVLVTNSYGAVTSQVATLTVLAPAQIAGQPVSQAVLVGSNATFSIAASGSSLDYRWFVNGIALTDGGRISGSTTPALSISNVQSGDAGGYFVIVSNVLSSARSLTASLTPLVALAPSVRYVARTCTNPSSPYLDWSTAATNIQDAVDAAVGGDTVLVTNGGYNTGGRVVFGKETNRVVLAKAITLLSVNGPQVTTVVGGHQMRGVYVGSNALVSGFTITNGYADVPLQENDVIREQSGGGVWCESTNAIVSNCILTSNYANGYGGGAFSGTLVACVVKNNQASLGGGGTCSNVLVNCVLTGNAAPRSQGAGGAQNCTLNNCTVVANTASGKQASGAYQSILNNCIVYYNTPIQDTYLCALNYCCTPAGSGVGVITNAPLFIDRAAGDFHLQTSSPCINSGYNTYATVTNDLDGNPRIAGGTVDMGAYEYPTPGSVISYAWLQLYGLPTDGSADYLDLDGTGMNNWQKWIAGLNPTNPASVFVMLPPLATTNPAGVIVTWKSVNTRTYYLQRATNLAAPPAFSILQSNIVGHTGTTSYTDPAATNGGPYFYRAGVQP